MPVKVKRVKSLPTLLLCCAASVSGNLANSTQAGDPGIEGTVFLAGSAFPGTEVVASSAASGQFWETSSDSLERYVLEGLPAGRYTVGQKQPAMDVLCLGTLWSKWERGFVAIFGSRKIRPIPDASQSPAGDSTSHALR